MNRKKWVVNLVSGIVKITGFLPGMLFLKPRVLLAKGAKRTLKGPAILISNHMSLMDFVLYLMIFPFSTIRFLMAEVLFAKGKLFAWFLRALGGVEVNRDSKDFSFCADALEILDNGGIVGIFPEGRLPINGKRFPFTVSSAFIAKNAPDVPVIPVYTDGKYGLFKRTSVVIGAPIYPAADPALPADEGDALKAITQKMEEEVYALKTLTEEAK